MKVLILSVTVGQGHNKTAEAIGEQLNVLGIDYTILGSVCQYYFIKLISLIKLHPLMLLQL